MSKAALKKELQRLTQEQLVEQILDLYDKNKSVKEFYLNPVNEKELVNIIKNKYKFHDKENFMF